MSEYEVIPNGQIVFAVYLYYLENKNNSLAKTDANRNIITMENRAITKITNYKMYFWRKEIRTFKNIFNGALFLNPVPTAFIRSRSNERFYPPRNQGQWKHSKNQNWMVR